MKFKAYKLQFLSDVHFGNGTLGKSDSTFHADTLFSALCQEALKSGEHCLQELLSFAENGELLFSDAMPYIGDDYFVPKPLIKSDHTVEEKEFNTRKVFKNMKFLPESCLDNFIAGSLKAEEVESWGHPGFQKIKVSASIRGESKTLPYRVGVFSFGENAGLYTIVGYENENVCTIAENLLSSLSFCGIGGRIRSGLGRFELYPGKLSESMMKRLTGTFTTYMTLSVSLPKETEMAESVQDSSFLLTKRSGFVASGNYADEYRRKKDLFVFSSGSCFKNRYQGDIYDVSSGGAHPVYRFAKPLFAGVK